MNRHQTAYDYVQAMRTQDVYTSLLDTALKQINLDNQVFGLADPVEKAYTNLVYASIGPELQDWLEWWMYECNYGTKPMHFQVNNVSYNPSEISLWRFLEIVDVP